jgi:hypothetical protein
VSGDTWRELVVWVCVSAQTEIWSLMLGEVDVINLNASELTVYIHMPAFRFSIQT